MTDLPVGYDTLPAKLGATARIVGDDLVLEIEPRPALVHHGIVRTSVLAYLVDCVAGIPFDRDAEGWTLTTDLTVRSLPRPAPARVGARFRLLRQGRRMASGVVDLRTDADDLIGIGAIGFAQVPLRAGDPPKVKRSIEDIVARFSRHPAVDVPLREAAGIEVVDPESGVVQVSLTDALRNPAGTLQGAMVALVAESAAEDVLTARSGCPVVVSDLDLRYLERTGAGPIRTRTEVLGNGADGTVVVELVDLSTGRVTTLAHARGVVVA